VSSLDDVFCVLVPRLLRRGGGRSEAMVAFVATGEPEAGYWVVSLRDGQGRRGLETDAPDVVIEASAAVLALLLDGSLDSAQAIARGVVVVRGNRSALDELARLIVPR
jgi:hypothetical protein